MGVFPDPSEIHKPKIGLWIIRKDRALQSDPLVAFDALTDLVVPYLLGLKRVQIVLVVVMPNNRPVRENQYVARRTVMEIVPKTERAEEPLAAQIQARFDVKLNHPDHFFTEGTGPPERLS